MRSLRFSCKCSDFSCLAETGAGAGPMTAQMWRCLCSCHGDGAISLVGDAVPGSHWRRDAVRAIFCFNGHISWKISPIYPSWLDISDILLPFKSEMWLESDSRLNNCRASTIEEGNTKICRFQISNRCNSHFLAMTWTFSQWKGREKTGVEEL